MKMQIKITLFLLMLTTSWSVAQERYQHYGTVTSFAGGEVTGVGIETIVIVGEPIIGPFSGGVYQGYAGFLQMNSECEVPIDLVVTNITDIAADVSWAANVTALNYRVRYRIEGNAEWTLQDVATESINLTGLESGMPYQVQVLSLCSGDNFRKSLWSEVMVFETTGATTCVTPTEIIISNSTATTADISWTGDGNDVDYVVKYKSAAEAEWVVLTVGSATPSISLTGLTAGKEYQIGIQADCIGDGSFLSPYSSFVNFTTIGTIECPTVTGLNGSVVSDTEISVTWNNLTEATNGYTLYYRIHGVAVWGIKTMGMVNSYLLSGLNPGNEYEIRVESLCNTSESISNFIIVTTTGNYLCNPPTTINLLSATDNSVDAEMTLDWQNVADYGYRIRYRHLGSIEYNYEQVYPNQATVLGLFIGTTYEVAVRSVCSFNGAYLSDWSATSQFTTSGTVSCDTPDMIVATPSGVNNDEVTIEWMEISSSYEYYQIQHKVKGTSIWSIMDIGVNSITLTGLEAGLTYQYRLRSMCESILNFASGWSETYEFTLGGVSTCEMPTGLAATTITVDNTVIAWDAMTSAVSYTLRYRQTGTGAWSYVETSTTSATFTDYATANYELQVRSNCDDIGTVISEYSNSIYVDALGSATCDPVLGLVLANNTDVSLTINWGASSGSYELSYKPTSSNVYTTINVNSIESYLMTGLAAGTDYNVRIRAYCSTSGIYSEYSQEIFATIGASVCEQATNVSSSNITDTSFDLSWDGTAQSGQFEVKYKPEGGVTWTEGVFGVNSANISGLQPSTRYMIYVFNWCSGQVMTSSTTLWVTTTGTSVCEAPFNLKVDDITGSSVTLSWEGEGTPGVTPLGMAWKYDGSIQWSYAEIQWKNSHVFTSPSVGIFYKVRKSCNDITGNPISEWSNVVYFNIASTARESSTQIIGDTDQKEASTSFKEASIYPNPFDDVISLVYQLQQEQQMTIEIIDLSGHVLKTLVNETQRGGSYKYNADLSEFSSGTYIVRFVYAEGEIDYLRIVKN